MKQIMERPLDQLFCKRRHFAQKNTCSCPGGAVDSREGGLAREHQLRGVRQDGARPVEGGRGARQEEDPGGERELRERDKRRSLCPGFNPCHLSF